MSFSESHPSRRTLRVSNDRWTAASRFPVTNPAGALPAMTLSTPRLGRFSLWIDAVGGYLVCPTEEVLVGQAVETPQVEIPLVGDVARRHLRIKRGAEAYVLEALAETRVNDQVVEGVVPLVDHDLIELTGGVKLRFRKPHPLSMTACLEVLTRHRTRPWSDGILLMAESVVLGSHDKDHVRCPGWRNELILFRRGDELHARYPAPLEIDGTKRQPPSRLTLETRVLGPDFSFSLEPVE